MKRADIHAIINNFIAESGKYGKSEFHRYSSFDYCYNYFKSGKNLKSDMEKSCLVLGFYLASWGMFRGSSFILQRSAKHFEKTIEYINGLDRSYWEIDVDSYDENITKIIEVYKEIKKKIVDEGKAHLTLVTKVMLGVFGFVPAYDNYFTDTFRGMYSDCGFRRFNKDSLECIEKFYYANKKVIDDLAKATKTYDFKTGKPGGISYTKAKIIDMYGFQIGLDAAKDRKRLKIAKT